MIVNWMPFSICTDTRIWEMGLLYFDKSALKTQQKEHHKHTKFRNSRKHAAEWRNLSIFVCISPCHASIHFIHAHNVHDPNISIESMEMARAKPPQKTRTFYVLFRLIVSGFQSRFCWFSGVHTEKNQRSWISTWWRIKDIDVISTFRLVG